MPEGSNLIWQQKLVRVKVPCQFKNDNGMSLYEFLIQYKFDSVNKI